MIETKASIDDVIKDAAAVHAFPLWKAAHARVASPNPRSVPYRWDFTQIRSLLMRAGELISAEEADRRVFMMINPGTEPPCTTETIAAAYQLILPGECAPAHRHTPFALRFIVEGSNAFTAVNGEKVWMEPGDLILTPSWTFHDHGKEGTGPMLWVDGLDVPLMTYLRIQFFEDWKEPRFPSVEYGVDSNLRYPWVEMQARLDAEPGPYARLEYFQRTSGAPISRTIGAAAERIAAGTVSPVRQATTSHVFVVHSGEGRTTIGSTAVDWKPGDVFAVPTWQQFHHAAGGTDAYLFSMHDRPLIEALGYYREKPPGA
ncbi:MAG: cupin domain-containing protein [Candidatus Lustribacter sp.]|jgi:gentisate 1,2-dioxygenase